ncbi:uncharacterized protein LOC134851768 isoform X2 [Symsagittifera roscoffensis]
MYVVHFLVASSTCVVMGVCYYNIGSTVRRQGNNPMQEQTDNYRRHQAARKETPDICLKEGDNEKDSRRHQARSRDEGGLVGGSSRAARVSGSILKCGIVESEVRTTSTGCSSIIDSTRRSGVKRGQRGHGHVTSSSMNNISSRMNNNASATTTQRGSKTTRICIYICVVYITLTMPSITSQLLFHTIPTLSKSQTMSDIFIMTYMLSLFNTVSNPLVYAIFQKKFFSELKQIWTTLKRLFCCQRGVNHLGNTLTTSNVKV